VVARGVKIVDASADPRGDGCALAYDTANAKVSVAEYQRSIRDEREKKEGNESRIIRL
jgi:hypothetical protein